MSNSNDFFAWKDTPFTPPTPKTTTNPVRTVTKTVTERVVTNVVPNAEGLEALRDLLRRQAKDMALARRSFSGKVGYLAAGTGEATPADRVIGETACRKYANVIDAVLAENGKEVTV